MSVWHEVHCDLQREGLDPNDILRARCWSHNNDNPSGWTRGMAMQNARRSGWIIRKNFHCCPGCAADLALGDKQ